MINNDITVFLVMLACGGGLSLAFDLFRAVRITAKGGTVFVALTDIIFCALFVYISAAAVWNFGSGKFRFYEIAGLCLGGFFYFSLLSRWILKFFCFIMKNILHFTQFLFKILLTQRQFLDKILIVPVSRYTGRFLRRSNCSHDKRVQTKDD